MISKRSLPHDWFPRPLPDNVEIGEGSWLYSSFAFLHCKSQRPKAVEIGRSSGIYNGSFFDLGPNGEVQIGDYSTLVGAIICSDQKIVIGNYVFIAHEVVLADQHFAAPVIEDSVKKDCDEMSSGRPKGITIGENVWIGAGALILSGAHIGSGTIIGAAAVVDFEVPENSVVTGNPARILPTPHATP